MVSTRGRLKQSGEEVRSPLRIHRKPNQKEKEIEIEMTGNNEGMSANKNSAPSSFKRRDRVTKKGDEAIADACKVSATFILDLGESEVPNEFEKVFNEDQELQQLINGEICMKVYPFSSEHTTSSQRKIILSGSFNPLHDGHLKLLEVATRMFGDGCPCFEISAINADKPPLTISQIKDRVRQFQKLGKTVIISNQPYFYKKADLFPGSIFVIGADTAARLINPKYYGESHALMLEVLLGCKSTGCTFLVAARNVDGIVKVLEDFEIPEDLRDMFISIPEESFRMDISSTELRNRG
ncbi:hypothetical protein GIB67_036432 [Kingdonia uniflora]|uniref:Cytidyltransferase-like domain-containing protein n=1 Tax=Kingdonia uniflora TaxID=39325 RepID=A0A7J7L437_9MAGN|nr:hypothetical protein GIB67_036432 [Kingdonia uniflora]